MHVGPYNNPDSDLSWAVSFGLLMNKQTDMIVSSE